MRNTRDIEGLDVDQDRMRAAILALGRLRCLRDPIASTFEALRFTPPQVHALFWLGFDGALTMGELARRSGVTEKTLTGVVDRMEGAKLVHRARDAQDRRVVHVALTRRGLSTFRRLERVMGERMGQMMRLLEPEDRRDLLRILEKVVIRVAAAPACAPGVERKNE